MPERFRHLLMALAFLLSACGNATESGVSVKQVATDLAFGIPEAVEPASPANLAPVPKDPIGVVVRDEGESPRVPPPPPGTSRGPCPEASLTEFPEAAPASVVGKPEAGDYRWKVEGDQVVPALGTVPLPSFSKKEVTDVEDVAGGFSFTVVERELTFGSPYTVRTTYEVLADDGIYLVRIERTNRQNEDSNSEFNPTPAILVLPLPIELGASVDSVGIDPVSLELLNQTGSIRKRERVDACGKVVDTFYAETTQEFVSASGEQNRRRYDYGIATLMGGLPVVERIESPCVDPGSSDEEEDRTCTEDAVTFRADQHIGQLEPD